MQKLVTVALTNKRAESPGKSTNRDEGTLQEEDSDDLEEDHFERRDDLEGNPSDNMHRNSSSREDLNGTQDREPEEEEMSYANGMRG